MVAGQQRAVELQLEEVERAMQPLLSFQAQPAEEITWYEDVRRRHFPVVRRLTDLGRLLIALRIANGLSQRGLAERLGVNESAVSRDERSEYHGITVERAQRILDALGATVTTRVEAPIVPSSERELVGIL
jgi:ribosome-binding protein aMBF1 (putative translation factor)